MMSPCPLNQAMGRHTLTFQELGRRFVALAVLDPHAAQPVAEPLVQPLQVRFALGMAEICHPPRETGVRLGARQAGEEVTDRAVQISDMGPGQGTGGSSTG